jgi:hypothetical protein
MDDDEGEHGAVLLPGVSTAGREVTPQQLLFRQAFTLFDCFCRLSRQVCPAEDFSLFQGVQG